MRAKEALESGVRSVLGNCPQEVREGLAGRRALGTLECRAPLPQHRGNRSASFARSCACAHPTRTPDRRTSRRSLRGAVRYRTDRLNRVEVLLFLSWMELTKRFQCASSTVLKSIR